MRSRRVHALVTDFDRHVEALLQCLEDPDDERGEPRARGRGGLPGRAAGVWGTGGEFPASRQFTRFAPSERGTAAAAAAYGGWRRAVRAALAWARDAEA